MSKSGLPPYVSEFVDQIGKVRLRFRRGTLSRYFTHGRGEPGMWLEYETYCAEYAMRAAQPAITRRIIPRSISDLLIRFYASTDWHGHAQADTIATRRAILDRFDADHGHRLVKDARFNHIDAIIQARSQRQANGTGGPFAARNLKKQLKRLFKYAVKLEWIVVNPVDHVAYRPPTSDGFKVWGETQIAAYQAHWPVGTQQRLALELALWTGKRRGDVAQIGPQHRSGDTLRGRDQKTGKAWALLIAPDLAHAIDAMGPMQHACYLVSQRGRPYSSASLGNMFRSWCDAAGLQGYAMHGLRKSLLTRLADNGASHSELKSVSLHSDDDTLAIYIRNRNQSQLAARAIGSLATKLSKQNPPIV
jgi:integrase